MEDKISSGLITTDCAVVGGGLAGLSAAIELAEAGKKVCLFTKAKLEEDSNSYLLAGGLTAVKIPSKNDSFEKHISDTFKAGKNLNSPEIVEYCSKHFFPDVIEWLINKGIKFDLSNGIKSDEFDLHREGGHSENRVFHVKDTTGRSIMESLTQIVRANKNITIFENHIAIDLIKASKVKPTATNDACIGLYLYDIKNDSVKTIECPGVFLATGGLGKVFMYTSNSDVATGDGFAIAYRAGLALVNMEFVQFHPTVFYDPNTKTEGERRFLLTEALRGAGAFLKIAKDSKEDFVLAYDSLGSKATRDVVSRAEDSEMRKYGVSHVWLDCTKIPADKIKKDFKNSYEFCLKKGFDLTKEAVPVVYAEHYSNGGVSVDNNSKTALEGLYVIGEASYTGLHGATRLASNSGPECVLFGRLAAKHFIGLKEKNKKEEQILAPLWDTGRAVYLKDKTTVGYYWNTIRSTMTTLCGIVRNEERLTAAREVLLALKKDIKDVYWNYTLTKEFLEVRNIVETALIIVESALARKETRACHYREDFPNEEESYIKNTFLSKDKPVEFIKVGEK